MARSRLAILGFAGLGALGTLGACGNLLGLDKFVDCTENPDASACRGDSSPNPPVDATTDAITDAIADSGPDTADVEPPPPPDGAVLSEWARYRMPNYEGGVLSPSLLNGPEGGPASVLDTPLAIAFWDAAPADGGMFATQAIRPNPGDPSVTVRGLSWFVHPDTLTTQTFARAQETCVKVGGGVPTRIEALTLLDPARTVLDGSTPFMMRPEVYPTNLAPRPPGVSKFWTATLAPSASGSQYWAIDFATGSVSPVSNPAPTVLGILCVLR